MLSYPEQTLPGSFGNPAGPVSGYGSTAYRSVWTVGVSDEPVPPSPQWGSSHWRGPSEFETPESTNQLRSINKNK